MKRSKFAGLALMGAAPFLLTACSDEPEVQQNAFTSVEECIQAKVFTPEACRSEYDKAVQSHQAQAPRFADQNACETQYGASNCQVVRHSDGTSWFVPAMAGFMIGRMMDRGREDQMYYGGGGGYYGGSYYRSQPLYRDRADRATWRTSDNYTVTRAGDGSSKAVTQSRSGFGSQAAARGSWGS